MDIEQLKKLIEDTPNDNELGKKLREWFLKQSKDNPKFINPYTGKVEE